MRQWCEIASEVDDCRLFHDGVNFIFLLLVMENFPGNETCLLLKFCFEVCFFKAVSTHKVWLLEPLQWLCSRPCSEWVSISGQLGHLFGKQWSHKLCWQDSNRTSTSSPGWVCHILPMPAAWQVTYFLQFPLCLHRKTEISLKGITLSWSSQPIIGPQYMFGKRAIVWAS